MKTLVMLLGVVAVNPLAGQDSALLGQVRDERLRPIHGAQVSISVNPTPGSREKPFYKSTLTGPDGVYQFRAPPGSFRMCAQLPNSDLLDNCTWESAAAVRTDGKQRTLAAPITLKRGVPVEVYLEDAGKLLADVESKGRKTPLLIGFRGKHGMFVPMKPHSKTEKGREFRLLVPRDTRLDLSISSRSVSIANDKGVALDVASGKGTNLLISGSRTSRRYVFRVTGKQAEGKP
jgi:hypothetical protein